MFLRAAIMPLLERLQDHDNIRHTPGCGALNWITYPMGNIPGECDCYVNQRLQDIIDMEMWVVLWIEPDNSLWNAYDSLVGVACTPDDVVRLIKEHVNKRKFANYTNVLVSYDQLPEYRKSTILAAYQAKSFQLKDVETDVERMQCTDGYS